MKKHLIIIIIAMALLTFLMFWKGKTLFTKLKNLLIQFEGYSATPYWDVNRYSWGYGTQAPNGASSGTISKTDAMNDALNFSKQQQKTLTNYLHQSLNDNQWAALLSFAYNLGTGNAVKLIAHINTGNADEINNAWLQYVNVNGVPSDDLEKRRQTELDLYNS